jgi:hypothetical protein
MSMILLAFGLVLVVEGLVLALAPLRLEQLVAMLAALSQDQRRAFGLGAVTLGVLLVAAGRWLAT